jgi:hypothetical protein
MGKSMSNYTDEDYEKLLDENIELQRQVKTISEKLHKYMEMLFDYTAYMDKFIEIKPIPTILTFILSCILSIVYCHFNFHTSSVSNGLLLGCLLWFINSFISFMYNVLYYNLTVDKISDDSL